MLNIMLSGCCGSMGRAVTAFADNRDDIKITAGIDREGRECKFPTFVSPFSFNGKVDVIIDFSSPDDANHMFYVGLAVHLFQHTLGLFAWTSFTAFFAAGCVATFFCHCLSSFLFLFHKAIDCFVQFFQSFHIPILNCIHNTMLYVIL